MEREIRIAVLMTCHNRKAQTLACLRSLVRTTEGIGNREQGIGADVDVFLNDDGCTDGTGEAVQEWYAHHSTTTTFNYNFSLHLLRGSGHDFWARGMERAWQSALDYEKEHLHSTPTPITYTSFLWLNDDTVLNPDALDLLLRAGCRGRQPLPDVVVNGTLVNAEGEPVYGLNVRNTGLAGNCVLVPRAVYEKVGMICGRYAHAWADRDYGLQVEKAGFRIVSAGVVGTAEWHPHRPSLAGRDLRWRWRSLWDPKGWNVHDLWLLRCRNWNVFYAIASCAHLMVHVLCGERISRVEVEKGR